ncbi:D-amino-acid transaminase [Psychrobacillus sp. FSL H8-0484]|uniref:D-amino-acid transaminase n=1 Tax=Psychrobacillus sp. FSL H8-0484 TaxID=2921390 RepID=UPI0030F70F28
MSIGYFNGEFIPVDKAVILIDERGHQFGDGVYEVIRVYNRKPFMLKEHIQRLLSSASSIKLNVNKSLEDIEDIITKAIENTDMFDFDIYFQMTRGIATRKHLFPDTPVSISMTVRPMKVMEDTVRKMGVNAIFHEDERWLNCHIKSLNLLPNILAKQTAHESGCYEAILIRNGFVTEGTSSNVYIIIDKKIYTTPLSKQILPGITRAAVKKIASLLQIDFIEKHITSTELLQADEVFITSTTNEILPIVNVDGTKINDGYSGELSLALYEKFKQFI